MLVAEGVEDLASGGRRGGFGFHREPPPEGCVSDRDREGGWWRGLAEGAGGKGLVKVEGGKGVGEHWLNPATGSLPLKLRSALRPGDLRPHPRVRHQGHRRGLFVTGALWWSLEASRALVVVVATPRPAAP